MNRSKFIKLKSHKDSILNNSADVLESYLAIIYYVKLIKEEGRSNGYLDRFYMVMSDLDKKDLEGFLSQRIYFINVMDDLEILVSGIFE